MLLSDTTGKPSGKSEDLFLEKGANALTPLVPVGWARRGIGLEELATWQLCVWVLGNVFVNERAAQGVADVPFFNDGSECLDP